MNKTLVRKLIISQCKNLTNDYRTYAQQQIFNNSYPLVRFAQKIAIYKTYAWEASLDTVIKFSLSHNKELYQPIAYKHTKNMHLELYTPNNTPIFREEASTIQHEVDLRWYNLDLIFLPLVASDSYGYRLGKGGGYYDTTLAKIKEIANPPILCGVGYTCQLIEKIEVDSWDIKLDYFVSDNELVKF